MKLLTKTTLYYITVSLFIFFLGGIGVYQLVKNLEEKKIEQQLVEQMHRLSHDLSQMGEHLKSATIISDGLIEMDAVAKQQIPPPLFSDTLIFEDVKKQFTPHKRLTFYLEIQEVSYKVTIYKSTLESNYLVEQVALIVTVIVIVFLLAVYFLYRYFFGRIWSDFFNTIAKIQQFDLSSPEKISFPPSMIIEFNELNQVLKKMIDRISADFEGLKDFTGNLTHEIQTPLAIIKSKTDMLLQEQNVNEPQMILASQINKETARISRLINALSLFTKLDQEQFPEKEKIKLRQLIDSKLELFEDFIEAKNIEINVNLIDTIFLLMNAELADILFSNLMKNAIRHNLAGGCIEIESHDKQFVIKNTGKPLETEPSRLFERFWKASRNSESLGIGLSIVKKICDHYQVKINYTFEEGLHAIKLDFGILIQK